LGITVDYSRGKSKVIIRQQKNIAENKNRKTDDGTFRSHTLSFIFFIDSFYLKIVNVSPGNMFAMFFTTTLEEF
jgi:hypothetical protein